MIGGHGVGGDGAGDGGATGDTAGSFDELVVDLVGAMKRIANFPAEQGFGDVTKLHKAAGGGCGVLAIEVTVAGCCAAGEGAFEAEREIRAVGDAVRRASMRRIGGVGGRGGLV